MSLSKIFQSKKILVVGDSILDWYVYGKVTRVSPEAPVPVVLKKEEKLFPGGSANVAQNVVSLGAEAHLLSICGDDSNFDSLTRICNERKIRTSFFKDATRPTTTKIRVIGNNHQITRIDDEQIHPIDEELEKKIFEKFQELVISVDAVIIQDYGKGVLTETLTRKIIETSISSGVLVIVDPKDKNLAKFSGCTLIKPNLSELKLIGGISPDSELRTDEIVSICRKIIADFGISMVLVTLSEEGMLLVSKKEKIIEPGIKIEVSDVSGAGDTVSATLALCLAGDLSLSDSIKISNAAGSIVCQFSGAVPIHSGQLFGYLEKTHPLLQSKDGSPILV